VAVIQRANSDLRLNPHVHLVCLGFDDLLGGPGGARMLGDEGPYRSRV
jgi:hypothetical protein